MINRELVDDESGKRKTVLENGLVIVSDEMSHVRSVSFGIFLRTGSRYEFEWEHGMTHFLEHAVFKGTRKRTAVQIAAESDALGGNLDAFTGREIVGFCNNVLSDHLPGAFELMADLVIQPVFDKAELDRERNVILEEIKMVEDTPDDIIFDIFCEHFYPGHSLGKTILGTPESLETFDPGAIRPYYREIFRPDNFVIAAAGNIDHEQLVELACEQFGSMRRGDAMRNSTVPRPVATITLLNRPDLEQSHLVIGAPCPSAVSDDRFAGALMTSILGGGMSSRLFQSVREDLGLVYNIHASTNPFIDCGYLSIYAGASTEVLDQTIEATIEQVVRLKTEPVGEEELSRNKDQLKTSLLLSLDSTSSRMSALAQEELTFGRFFTTDEIIAGIDAVTCREVQQMAGEIFTDGNLSVAVLGDLDGFELERSQLNC